MDGDRDEPSNATPDRRSVLRLTTGAVAGAAVSGVAKTSAAAARPSDIVAMDAVGLAKAIRTKKVSCVEVMAAYLDQIERVNPSG